MSTSGRGEVGVILVVDDAHLESLDQVVGRLREAGLEIGEVNATIGQVTGVAPLDRLPALEAVEGVEAVEQERTFQLPDPDSPIQ